MAVKLAGRLDQRRIQDRQWLFDVAHNVEGIDFVLPQLWPIWQRHLHAYPDARLHLVFSMLADKPIQAVVTRLCQSNLPITQWHVAAIDHPRAASLETLMAAIEAQRAECVRVYSKGGNNSLNDNNCFNDNNNDPLNDNNAVHLTDTDHRIEAVVTPYADLAEASLGVLAKSAVNDFIVVCGSFHTISEVLLALKVEAIPC